MASPTTAGKGCDPLYENTGCGRVAGSVPPQAESQYMPMNTPTWPIGITTQFAWQPIVENVTFLPISCSTLSVDQSVAMKSAD